MIQSYQAHRYNVWYNSSLDCQYFDLIPKSSNHHPNRIRLNLGSMIAYINDVQRHHNHTESLAHPSYFELNDYNDSKSALTLLSLRIKSKNN